MNAKIQTGMNTKVKVALVDDHVLLRKGLISLVEKAGFLVHSESNNGSEFISNLNRNDLPDITLLDINMPIMDGFDTARWITRTHPSIKILALSMYDDELSIIRMLKSGARGYIVKDSDPGDLQAAIDSIMSRGYHYTEKVSGLLIHRIHEEYDRPGSATEVKLNERETQFLILSCTEMTYKEIAKEMNVSPRTVDGYREALFTRLNVKSRVGLVVYAIRNKIVRFN
jgi:DNA-binding NarL/FixJ family response regulator